MPEFTLSANAPSGRTAKLRIEASNFASAVRKAEKHGYTMVTPFQGEAMKTEAIPRSAAVPQRPARNSLFQAVMRLHWSLRYGFLAAVGLCLFALTYVSKGDDQRQRMKRVALELGGQKYGEAYYHMACMMPSSADEASSRRTLRGRPTDSYDTTTFVRMIREELARNVERLRPASDPQRLYQGYWVKHADMESGQRYDYHRFDKNGTCEVITRVDDGRSREVARTTVTVRLDGIRLTWEGRDGSDPDQIESMSDRFMILDELDGRYTCWMHVDSL